jgi:hypothetical protein
MMRHAARAGFFAGLGRFDKPKGMRSVFFCKGGFKAAWGFR